MNYDQWKLMTPEEADPKRRPLRDKSRDEYNHEDKIRKESNEANK